MSVDYEDEVMEQSRTAFEKAVVGRRIVLVEQSATIRGDITNADHGMWASKSHAGIVPLVLTLDDGTKVGLLEQGDCCAFTDLNKVIERLPVTEHVITSVKADNERDTETWHILSGMNDVLDLEIGWSEGTGYYAYGFKIVVQKERS